MSDEQEPQISITEDALRSIAVSMSHAAAALLKVSGMAHAEFDENDALVLRRMTPEEQAEPASPTKWLRSKIDVVRSGEGPLAWSFLSPAPYDGIEIVCSPDSDANVGMRCMATSRNILAGDRKKFKIVFEEES